MFTKKERKRNTKDTLKKEKTTKSKQKRLLKQFKTNKKQVNKKNKNNALYKTFGFLMHTIFDAHYKIFGKNYTSFFFVSKLSSLFEKKTVQKRRVTKKGYEILYKKNT